MAIEKEQLLKVIAEESTAEAKAEVLQGMANEEITKILLNKEDILKEKKEEVERRKKAETELAELRKKNTELDELLKKNSPDEVKAVYESKLSEANLLYKKQQDEFEIAKQKYEQQLESLGREKFKLSCIEEYNKAIAGKNIDPSCADMLRTFVLGNECSNFMTKDLGNEKLIVNAENQQIASAVKAVLDTPFGKKCVTVNTSGGGAGGSQQQGDTGTNPFKKETFNLTEQMRLYREDPERYRLLKQLAENSK